MKTNYLEKEIFHEQKFLFSKDEKKLIGHIYEKIPHLQKENIEFLTLHIKKFLLNAFEKNSRVEIRKFGNFSVRKRKFQYKTSKYRFVHFKMSSKIFSHDKQYMNDT